MCFFVIDKYNFYNAHANGYSDSMTDPAPVSENAIKSVNSQGNI